LDGAMSLADGFTRDGSDVQSIATKSLIGHDGCAGRSGSGLCWEATRGGISRSPMRQRRSATRRTDRLVGCFSSTLDIGVMPQKSNAERVSVETSVFYS